MFGIGADNAHNTAAADDLALGADLLNARANLHDASSAALLVSVGDASAGQVVG